MPGWHEETKELQETGKVRMVGIIQEQHPDRCRLFMQWKQMDWPILVDALNLLEVPLVPITLSIDEHGVVRKVHGPMSGAKNLEKDLVEAEFTSPGPAPPEDEPADLEALARRAEGGEPEALHRYANQLVLWGGPERLEEAIAAYERALAADPENGWLHFRLGVAHRARYDGEHGEPEDFQQAVVHWDAALQIDPNNYIWRRRIQQYGPRLDKPYPFYSWVETARAEIRERGETPAPLVVEPRGAELAERAGFEAASGDSAEPDPAGRIDRDREGFVSVESTVVPPAVTAGNTARVHLRLTPNEAIRAHWNNEVEDLVVWLEPPPGWEVDEQILRYPNPPYEVSREEREVEFEVRAPKGADLGRVAMPAYALYYVCEDVNGVCLYRRQDLAVEFEVREKAP